MRTLSSRYRLFAADLPGHGKSWPLPDTNCHQDIDSISNWLAAFMRTVGADRFVAMGCSLGGNLSLYMAAKVPGVTAAVALEGCDWSPAISETTLDLLTHPQVSLMHLGMDFTMSLVGRDSTPEGRSFSEWGVLSLIALAQQADLRAYSHCDFRHLTPTVRVPVLIVRGTDDWVVSQQMVEDTRARLVNAPVVQLETLGGIGHFPHVEAPDLIAETTLRFLSSVSL
jgi:pimeloyl-ACP methyl ester carboxylesterase